MKTYFYLFSIPIALFFSACNQNKEVQISDMEKLCDYAQKNISDASSKDNCKLNEFILQLTKQSGVISFSSSLNSYTVRSSVNGAYDCVIIGILCNQYKQFEGKTVEYSAKVYAYKGSYKPAVGGEVIFIFDTFNYSVK
jgi:hypothetical protein